MPRELRSPLGFGTGETLGGLTVTEIESQPPGAYRVTGIADDRLSLDVIRSAFSNELARRLEPLGLEPGMVSLDGVRHEDSGPFVETPRWARSITTYATFGFVVRRRDESTAMRSDFDQQNERERLRLRLRESQRRRRREDRGSRLSELNERVRGALEPDSDLGARILAERFRRTPSDPEQERLRERFEQLQQEQERLRLAQERRELQRAAAARREVEHTLPRALGERLAEVGANLRGGWDELRDALAAGRLTLPAVHPFNRCVPIVGEGGLTVEMGDAEDERLRGMALRVELNDERVREQYDRAVRRIVEHRDAEARRLLGMPRACGTRIRGGVYWSLLPRLETTPPAGGDWNVYVDQHGNIRDRRGAEQTEIRAELAVERYMFDPPRRLNMRDLGVSSIGVKMIERDGVTHLIDVIGTRYYPNVADFLEEARVLGISRRLPVNLPWDRLTSESRLIVAHAHAYIDDVDRWSRSWRRLVGNRIICPRSGRPHTGNDSLPMCCGLYWLDLVGGTILDTANSNSPVERRMPWGAYQGYASPVPNAKRHPAVFASFPLGALHVVDDPYDGTHNAAFERIGPNLHDSVTLERVEA